MLDSPDDIRESRVLCHAFIPTISYGMPIIIQIKKERIC